MLLDLALRLGHESEAQPVARARGRKTDCERAAVPQRIQQAGASAQLFDAPSSPRKVIGFLAGSALEDHLTRREALEIIVELDNTGELRAITQDAKAGTFQQGERVRLVTGGGLTRVEKLAKD